MQNKFTSKGKHLDFMLIDLLCVMASFFLAIIIRGSDFILVKRLSSNYDPRDLDNLIIIIALMHIVLVMFTENYSGITRRGYGKELKSVLVHNFELLAGTFLMLFLSKNEVAYSRLLIVIFAVINIVLMFIGRCVRKKMLYRKSASPKGKTMMLVVGNYDKVVEIVATLKAMKFRTFWIKGIVVMDKDMTGEKISGIEVVSSLDNMLEYVKSNVIDEVFLDHSGSDVKYLVDRFIAMGTVIHVCMNEILENVPKSTVNRFDKYMAVTGTVNFMTKKQIVVKRLMDIGIAIPGVIVTGIFCIIFGPIIYIQSPGPIFFKQTRVGRNGRTFKIYKFRSMYMDAEERKKELMEKNKMFGLMFKMDNDPRITPIGRFIRKTSIDEFPQFINILKGDMSFVGTRPPTWDEYSQYEQHHKIRLAIKPGLTGMWQVSGRSEITDFEEVVRLDNEYIKNFCLSLDVKIILKTVVAVLKRKGSV